MKKGFMLFTLLAAFSGFAQADDAAIQQTLAKMGIKSSDIQPAPVAGMKTVLTNSGVLYITLALLPMSSKYCVSIVGPETCAS